MLFLARHTVNIVYYLLFTKLSISDYQLCTAELV